MTSETKPISEPKIPQKKSAGILTNLSNAMDYLEEIIGISIQSSQGKKDLEYPLFEFEDNEDPFYQIVQSCQLCFEEFVILLLSLAPHIRPNLVDAAIERYLKGIDSLPEIGGVKDKDLRYMMPTGDTALYLLAGNSIERRMEVLSYMDSNSFLARENIVQMDTAKTNLPISSGALIINKDYLDLFTKGSISIPEFSSSFPAQHITTDLSWKDLIVNQDITEKLKGIKNWIDHHQTLLYDWGMKSKLRPGYLVLLHGPPGTGKSFASSLLGKYTNRNVFRIDLSTLVSKYIGETEKNLSNLFDKAESKNWILVFEEADSLFSKRTAVQTSNDRYANQEVSFLLQRIETFAGLVILTSNLKSNMDDAFLRRFNSIIHFPLPELDERTKIWRNAFPDRVKLNGFEKHIADAAKYELAGGDIINVVQYTCLKAIEKDSKEVAMEDILAGIKAELEKSGKRFKN